LWACWVIRERLGADSRGHFLVMHARKARRISTRACLLKGEECRKRDQKSLIQDLNRCSATLLSSRQAICEHQRIRRECKDCGGFCEHQRWRSTCKDCGGSAFCEHQRIRRTCKECGGSAICEQRIRRTCKDCGGSAFCEHQRIRRTCKDCGGSSICDLRAPAHPPRVQGFRRVSLLRAPAYL